MASEGGEKTEAPTPRKRQEARKKGQVARSPELAGAVALLALVVTLRAALGGSSGGALTHYLQSALAGAHENLYLDPAMAAARAGREAVMTLLRTLGLIIGVGMAAGVAASVAQVGFLFTTQPVLPDPGRINPLTGAGRLLGPKGAFETGKAVAKMALVGVVAFVTLRAHVADLVALITLPGAQWLARVGQIAYLLALRVSVTLFIVAVADYAYQRWDYEKSLKMSKEEIKQEMKQSEGDPHIKAAIRRRQRDMAQKRMMADVPKADVVITNPTHVAVALAYDANNPSSGAPRVLAKGVDQIALKIREIAGANQVPLVENVPLARALNQEVEIGREIPAALYAAVAEVLAYVYEQERKTGRSKNRAKSERGSGALAGRA